MIRGEGFVPLGEGFQALRLLGEAGGSPVNLTVPLAFEDEGPDEGSLVWVVEPAFLGSVPPGGPPFTGTLEVIRLLLDRESEGDSGDTRSLEELDAELRSLGWLDSRRCRRSPRLDAVLHTALELLPGLTGPREAEAWLGDLLPLEGGSWLTPTEGFSLARLDGVYSQESPPRALPVSGLTVPLEVLSRDEAFLRVGPELFGIRSGSFLGSLTVINAGIGGPERASETLEGFSLRLLPSRVDAVSPGVVRRGQRVTVTGRGFLPGDEDLGTISLLRLSGTFTRMDGTEIGLTGFNALSIFPDEVLSGDRMEVVLRAVEGIDGELEGLGLEAGIFSGEVAVELFHGADSWISPATALDLVVAMPLQVVFLKYLPSFDDSLERFGLFAARGRVHDRILEVCETLYAPFNVEFRQERPEDFADYSILELAGTDPNNAGLLGLDNTTGKDNGNLRFNDVIGGLNAETEEAGYYAFGGVFLESFMSFSPSLGKGESAMEHPRFDGVFGAFAPDLGGSPLAPEELLGASPRREAALEAIRVLGTLVGGTVAHEIGHSLGLAMVPGQPEEFHNPGDTPRCLMDAGSARPFLERADLDGQGPEVFCPASTAYLQEILPRD
ncbi:MAG: hypothetical protein FJ098_10810 [Deltaproteobacteria bacterium]|nr:hypothetical protein [Deltaproteobacteria bacterium]